MDKKTVLTEEERKERIKKTLIIAGGITIGVVAICGVIKKVVSCNRDIAVAEYESKLPDSYWESQTAIRALELEHKQHTEEINASLKRYSLEREAQMPDSYWEMKAAQAYKDAEIQRAKIQAESIANVTKGIANAIETKKEA